MRVTHFCPLLGLEPGLLLPDPGPRPALLLVIVTIN